MIIPTNAANEAIGQETEGMRHGLHRGRSARLAAWALVAVLLIGVLLRASQYISKRSLWLDEGSLALNFLDRGYAKLLQPFANHQSAPLGFNALSETVLQLVGMSELSLRLIPFLAAIASLFIFLQITRRWLRGWAFVLTNYAFAISSSLVYYSNEFKPYGTDVFFTLVLLWATLAWLDSRLGWKGTFGMALLGALAVWLSFPAIFVLAGAGSAALVRCVEERYARGVRQILVAGAIWLVSFGCHYALHVRQIAAMGDLTEYWRNEGAFMPMPPWRELSWFTSSFFGYFQEVAGLHNSRNLWQLLLLCGITALAQRRAAAPLVLLLVPTALALAASALERYPFQGRLILFTVPLALILCGEGIAALFRALSHRKVIACLLAAIAFFSPSAYTLPQLWRPVKVEEVRPIAEFLKEKASPRDLVLLFENNAPFRVYGQLMGLPQETIGFSARDLGETLAKTRGELERGRACWLVISHATDPERAALLAEFGTRFHVTQALNEVGAGLFRLEMAPGS